ncbi:hypothetical protein [Arthrobacter sp. OV608]|uniref:phage late control D family protein n=1 Tax=Arthrobacter sp. OV608 TaxID=1882768 RepID=UPI00147B081D|nr:hypothetical protein [Arthrobacter sp. OV608]
MTLEEALGGQSKVSVVVTMATGMRSTWNSPLDSLVAPAARFGVEIYRGGRSFSVDARSVAASWSFVPGGVSTLTVEGMDRSVELDRRDVQKLWQDTTDSTIARTIFGDHGLPAQVDSTPSGADSETYSPQQDATDWAFLKGLAGRNGFDVYVESVEGVPTGMFRKIDVTAAPQVRITLGYGEQGGRVGASVQLLTGQEVHVTRSVPGTADVDVANDNGMGQAMGSRSLGGVTLVRTNTSAGMSVVDARTTAIAMAERSAFGATLTVTLTAPDAPLVRARRTVRVAGLGEILDGPWLVRSVRHTVTPGGHTQALSLTRNALGDPAAGGVGALAAAAGVSL